MRNAGLEEAQAGIKIAGRNINNLRYADDTTLMAEREEELKSLLMKMKEESEKFGLKLNIQKSGYVWMWELDYKESWDPKSWCVWPVVLEKTLESPLDCKEIQPVHPKGDQFWMFIGRTDVEAETPILLATSCEELTHWKRPWCWEGLGAGGEGDDRGWDGWMASPTRWTWVWVNSGS